MNAMRRHSTSALAVLALAPHAGAALYDCPSTVDDSRVVTNLVDEAQARERACQPLQTRRSTLDQARARMQDTALTRAQPVAHRITSAAQRARDAERLSILQAELDKEEEEAQRVQHAMRADGTTPQDRAELGQTLSRHVSNIEALKREIAHSR